MEVAIFLFGLIIGALHMQDAATPEAYEQVAQNNVIAVAREAGAEPVLASRASTASHVAGSSSRMVNESNSSPLAALALAQSKAELTQLVADLVAAYPASATNIVTIALAQMYTENTIGDVALIAATATKAAPQMAPAIATVVARSVGESAAGLSAAIASIIALAPEQTQQVAAAVGAQVGNKPVILGMIAQTVAIAVGEETFTALSASSGASISALMKESSRLGVNVPFEVPNYAAQTAPRASMVADTAR